MKVKIKITQVREGFVEMDVDSPEAGLKAAETIYSGGAELPDMEDCQPLQFSLAEETRAPERKNTMDISIYQINKKRDPKRLVFSSYSIASKHMGGQIDASMYDKVYDGKVNANNLEDVYYIFNERHPSDYRARSLSMSDIVEVREDNASHFFFCDTFGFRRIEFDPQLAEDRTGRKPSLASQISFVADKAADPTTTEKKPARTDMDR